MMKLLEEVLTATQDQLFTQLCAKYKNHCKICEGAYILVEGKAPVMLLAHLDTVHMQPVKDICMTCDGRILMSPQGIGGDDRCGVYALNWIYDSAKVKPWLLFTCDEEIGGIGAEKFWAMHREGKLPKALDDLKMLIEIDRKGENDAVYYDCVNAEFERYVAQKGFKREWGSFSDISIIAPELGVAAVNLSSGYYNPHQLHEYINTEHLNATTLKVLGIVEDCAKKEMPRFEYHESPYLCRCGTGYHTSDSIRRKKASVPTDRSLNTTSDGSQTERQAIND